MDEQVADAQEDAGAEPGSWLRRHRRALAVAALVAVLAAVGAGALVAWNFSSLVVVPRQSDWPENVKVEARGEGTVVLSREEASERPGAYGLVWQGGRAIVGEVVRRDADSVTRRLRDVRGYLVPGMEVGVDFNVWGGNPRQTLGIPFREVRYPSEIGPMPAWEVPGRSRTWAIVVHGINGDPQAGLRLLPALRRAGVPALLISYREDLGAPSADGKHHMGLTEWRDVQSAARYAFSRGARRIVLVGYSMGGAIVSQFMQRSPLADRLAGLVLDAPALDWRQILSFNATEMGLPGLAAKPVEWAIGMRIDVDWDSLDAAAHPEDFQLPILLFHGEEDDVVPIAVSEDFAAALPGRVEFHRVPEAGHTEAWNVERRRYERQLERFLERIGASAPQPVRSRGPAAVPGR